MNELTIIGGGLAGCEAAMQAAKRGLKVRLHEMRPVRPTPAHTTAFLAELVCSNSLKSDSIENASGLLKEEMRLLGSLILKAAEATKVPAGKTLAVDRAAFAEFITKAVGDAGIEVIRNEVAEIPAARPLIIASGPLTSDAFASSIQRLVGSKSLFFYDAVAPIVNASSVDMTRAFFASRYGKGGDDYINCPMSEEEYQRFYEALTSADKVERRSFESMASFEACMPIEVMAERGPKTLLFGPMRPVGLTDPRTGKRPFAVVQLRKENSAGTIYNIVGFQTRLTYPEQKRVLKLIPALENAEFARLGKLHRNSYIDSPRVLAGAQQLKDDPLIIFAGQITGVEGYCESAASGIIAGINAARLAEGKAAIVPPETTITGALLKYTVSAHGADFSPMNANMGLLPPIPGKEGRALQAKRALSETARWANENLETPRTI